MKLKTLSAITAMLLVVSVFGQKATIDLTFTAVNNAAYVQLDSIKVMNITQHSDTWIYWPDTSLTIDITQGDTLLNIGYSTGSPIGIEDINNEGRGFQLFQNYPNPANDHTVFSFTIPERGNVQFIVSDILGREVFHSERLLNKGIHSFRFSPGSGKLFFLTARWNGVNRSIKIITTKTNSRNTCDIDYIESKQIDLRLKASSFKQISVIESGILDNPISNETYIFQFAYNIPCPGTPSVTYSGQVYNTVQILSQCWLKENLNAGAMIDGNINMTDNGVMEKHCFDNNQANCTKYGGLYQWDEMMQYTTQQGAQGLCPLGWHIPCDKEWNVLEGAVDSQYGIGDPEWNSIAIRGFDAGTNLRTTTDWESPGNGTDIVGFSGLPGGLINENGNFYDNGFYGYWWNSTEYNYDNAWDHFLNYNSPDVTRFNSAKGYSFSVRCVRDE